MTALRGLLAFLLLGSLLCLTTGPAEADDESHYYNKGDPVNFWMNKVGPYHNPMETYPYFSLPFCRGERLQPEVHSVGLGEVLEGNELVNSNIKAQFMVNQPVSKICSQKLSAEDVKDFKFAVTNHYWYQMYVDDLPLWGLVGKVVAAEDKNMKAPVGSSLLFTHKKFSISYNGPHIIHVNISYTNNAEMLEEGREVSFTYEISWSETDIDFDDRFDRYLEEDFFEHQIHWFSIFNSFMMVIFLCGLVALILLRTLKNDYAKYTREDVEADTMDRGMGDDTGWKQVSGDVFRRPEHLMILSALLGSGAQVTVVVLCVILFAIVGALYVEPGAITSAVIAIYSLSSFLAGYVSGAYYQRYFYPQPSEGWIHVMLLTVSLLPALSFSVIFCINWIAVYYGTTFALPFGSILKILLLWVFVAFPLAICGTILGRNWSGKPDFPCRVSRIAHHIPPSPWYLQPRFIILSTGILPFGSIFIEMYFIFTSFWNYKFYYVYGFMLLIFLILIVVTMCVAVVATYFLLNSENWRWHWTVFLASASTAAYVFAYAVYFYFFKTRMYGFLQTSYYFGYMFLFCSALSIMCGYIGYCGSEIFVKRIYRDIKCE